MRAPNFPVIDNELQNRDSAGPDLTLDELPVGRHGVVTTINASQLGEIAAQRLLAMGLERGAMVEPLHKGVLWAHDPVAVRVGRRTLALRRSQAQSIEVDPQ